jgi:hypothetical protein
MATHEHAVGVGIELRDALNDAANDGRFDENDRDDFSTLHAVVSRHVSDFALRPRYGANAPQYDSFVATAGAATTAVRNCNPASPASVQSARSRASQADAKLSPITGPA